MNIDQRVRLFIDLRGHRDALYIALVMAARKLTFSIFISKIIKKKYLIYAIYFFIYVRAYAVIHKITIIIIIRIQKKRVQYKNIVYSFF